MANPKFDGVIEAVRYDPDGHIALARIYERRGAVWSDALIMNRSQLIERLSHGKRFVTGQRKIYLGAIFETGKTVHMNDQSIVVGDRQSEHDHLPGVPIF